MKTRPKLIITVSAVFLGGVLLLSTAPVLAQTGEGSVQRGLGKFFGEGVERFSRHGMRFKSEFLGIDTSELEAQLQDQTFSDILDEQGFSKEEFWARKNAMIRQRWEERNISSEEIEERLELLELRRGNCDSSNRFSGSPFGRGGNR